MDHSRFSTIAILVLGLTCASCGGRPEGYYPVVGRVMYKGQPAAGAVLFFQLRGEGERPQTEAVASATVEDDGSFRVVNSALIDGVAPGKYAVMVAWPEKTSPDGPPASEGRDAAKKKGKAGRVKRMNKRDPLSIDRLKGRYRDSKKPLLVAEVKAQSTDLGTLELSD